MTFGQQKPISQTWPNTYPQARFRAKWCFGLGNDCCLRLNLETRKNEKYKKNDMSIQAD